MSGTREGSSRHRRSKQGVAGGGVLGKRPTAQNIDIPISSTGGLAITFARFSQRVNRLESDVAGKANLAVGIFRTVEEVTATATLTGAEDVVLVDASSAAVILTLPAAGGIEGRIYDIKKIDSSTNAVTLDGDGSETIDGSTTISTTVQYHSWTVVSDGSSWSIL